MQEYDAFIDSLKKLKTHPLPAPLLECISHANLMALVDDLLTNEKRQDTFQNLKPKQAVRIEKSATGPSRSFCVLRDHNGKYQCILETKSKDATNKKRKIETANGTYKFGKPAWRLDGKNGPKPYFSLKILLKSKATQLNLSDQEVIDKLINLKAEINFPWELPKDYGLQRYSFGDIHVNKKGLVASVYSKMGTTLNIANRQAFALTEQERDDISSSLLRTVDLLHDKGVIYQDIKPENILVFRRKNKKIKVTLSDPGSIFKPGMDPNTPCLATYGYESPEVALAHSKQSIYSSHYRTEYKKLGLTLGKVEANKILDEIKKQGPKKVDQLLQSVLKPHPANDMWALGTTLHFLFRKTKPRPDHVPTTPFFAGFFAPRPRRVTAKQAVASWQSELKNKIT